MVEKDPSVIHVHIDCLEHGLKWKPESTLASQHGQKYNPHVSFHQISKVHTVLSEEAKYRSHNILSLTTPLPNRCLKRRLSINASATSVT